MNPDRYDVRIEPGERWELPVDDNILTLYRTLGKLPGSVPLYVDTQDGHAYRVTGIRRDEQGDLILETVSQDDKAPAPIRKHQ